MTTSNLDIRQESYNKLTNLPDIPYNIATYLANNNDYIWKLLRYNDNKAYEKPNLTSKEKLALIYDGMPEMTNYRVFFFSGQDASWLKETCTLRIVVAEVQPSNYVYANMVVGFEVFTHSAIETLYNHKTRSDIITQQLIETLNGAEIEGCGRLFFDQKAYRSRISLIGSIPFRGKAITMCNHLLG